MEKKKRRIAILGGGLGGISTALWLTHPGNQDAKQLEVTIYQTGWRLGGKCASGRNMDAQKGLRIEEHGLHVMLGFYENTFRMIRETMAEWKIPAGHPWWDQDRTNRWSKAFTPADFAPVVEPRSDGHWEMWRLSFPSLSGTPGDGSPPRDDLIDYLGALGAWIRIMLDMAVGDDEPDRYLREWLENPRQDDAAKRRSAVQKSQRPLSMGTIFPLLRDLIGLLWLGLRTRGLLGWRRRFSKMEGRKRQQAAMLEVFLDIGWALFWGLFWNSWRIYWKSLDVLDKHDLRTFLRRFGASRTSVQSPLIDALYDAAFASRRGTGELGDESFAAGVAIRSFINITLGYKGAPWWKMNAGMGDTIFTPAYQVLRQRGVKFKFFHCVRNIELTEDGKQVAAIQISRQAHIVDPETSTHVDDTMYQPLVPVYVRDSQGGHFPDPLMCWPDRPDYRQLEEGLAIKQAIANGANLEAYESPWPVAEEFALREGEHFDHVVLAVPLPTFRDVCPDLLASNPKVREMVDKVGSVRTAAYQIWLSKDLWEMGWDDPRPVLGNFMNPMNTWSDMSHLLPVEGAQQGVEPGDVSYFVGPMPESVRAEDAEAYVATKADELMTGMTQNFLPGALDRNTGAFDQRLKLGDYVRANVTPAQLYVLSLAGTTRYRLRADETGLTNLTFAGDWTRNGFNVGAAEPTVMSAMQASNAVCGYPPGDKIVRGNGP